MRRCRWRFTERVRRVAFRYRKNRSRPSHNCGRSTNVALPRLPLRGRETKHVLGSGVGVGIQIQIQDQDSGFRNLGNEMHGFFLNPESISPIPVSTASVPAPASGYVCRWTMPRVDLARSDGQFVLAPSAINTNTVLLGQFGIVSLQNPAWTETLFLVFLEWIVIATKYTPPARSRSSTVKPTTIQRQAHFTQARARPSSTTSMLIPAALTTSCAVVQARCWMAPVPLGRWRSPRWHP